MSVNTDGTLAQDCLLNAEMNLKANVLERRDDGAKAYESSSTADGTKMGNVSSLKVGFYVSSEQTASSTTFGLPEGELSTRGTSGQSLWRGCKGLVYSLASVLIMWDCGPEIPFAFCWRRNRV